jgi:Ulp1 family protease
MKAIKTRGVPPKCQKQLCNRFNKFIELYHEDYPSALATGMDKKWDLTVVADIPAQTNGDDCGIFTIM